MGYNFITYCVRYALRLPRVTVRTTLVLNPVATVTSSSTLCLTPRVELEAGAGGLAFIFKPSVIPFEMNFPQRPRYAIHEFPQLILPPPSSFVVLWKTYVLHPRRYNRRWLHSRHAGHSLKKNLLRYYFEEMQPMFGSQDIMRTAFAYRIPSSRNGPPLFRPSLSRGRKRTVAKVWDESNE